MLFSGKRERKYVVIAVISAFAVASIFFLSYFFSLFRMTEINISPSIKLPTKVYVDDCNVQRSFMMPNGYWNISGWFYNKNEDINTVQVYVILHDQTDGKYYKIHDSQSVVRKDITTCFHDGHNYDYSGFYAAVDSRWLVKGRKYKVGILSVINSNAFFAETGKIVERVD